jgi:hypothetical protein
MTARLGLAVITVKVCRYYLVDVEFLDAVIVQPAPSYVGQGLRMSAMCVQIVRRVQYVERMYYFLCETEVCSCSVTLTDKLNSLAFLHTSDK